MSGMKVAMALLLTASFVLMGEGKQAKKGSDKETKRLEQSGEVLKQILKVPDNIPRPLLDRAECVVVIPSVKKFAIGIGGSYGRGAMSCRTDNHLGVATLGRRSNDRLDEVVAGLSQRGKTNTDRSARSGRRL